MELLRCLYFSLCIMTASVIAVILESTMNFKLFAKRKEVVEGEVKETMIQSMKAGLVLFEIATYHYGDYLDFPIHQLPVWCIQVGYSFILIEKMKMASTHFGYIEGAFAVGMLLMSIYLSVRKEMKFPLLVGKRGIIGMGLIMGGIGIPLIVNHALLWHVRLLCNAHVRFRTDDDYCQYTDASDDAKND